MACIINIVEVLRVFWKKAFGPEVIELKILLPCSQQFPKKTIGAPPLKIGADVRSKRTISTFYIGWRGCS
jgi:hypothetical protein